MMFNLLKTACTPFCLLLLLLPSCARSPRPPIFVNELPQETIVPSPPPYDAVPLDARPAPPPGSTAVWQDGYWHWYGDQYAWIDGQWVEPPEDYYLVEASYVYHDNRWHYRPCYWQHRRHRRHHNGGYGNGAKGKHAHSGHAGKGGSSSSGSAGTGGSSTATAPHTVRVQAPPSTDPSHTKRVSAPPASTAKANTMAARPAAGRGADGDRGRGLINDQRPTTPQSQTKTVNTKTFKTIRLRNPTDNAIPNDRPPRYRPRGGGQLIVYSSTSKPRQQRVKEPSRPYRPSERRVVVQPAPVRRVEPQHRVFVPQQPTYRPRPAPPTPRPQPTTYTRHVRPGPSHQPAPRRSSFSPPTRTATSAPRPSHSAAHPSVRKSAQARPSRTTAPPKQRNPSSNDATDDRKKRGRR